MNHVKFFGVYENKLLNLFSKTNREDILYLNSDALYQLGSFELSLGVWRNIAIMLKELIPNELQHKLQYGPEYMAFDITSKGPVKKDIYKPERVGAIEQYFGYDLVEVYNRDEVKIILHGLEEVGKDEKSLEGNTTFYLSEMFKNNFFKDEFTHLLIYCEV